MFGISGSTLFGVVSVLLTVTGQAELSLLTNNISAGKPNDAFPAGTSVIPTKMSASWIKEGEFATDPETIKTSYQGDASKMVLFDGNTGSNWKSRTYSEWSEGKWATLNIDLGESYALQQFDLWALHEPTRGTESMEVLLSEDGKTFTPQGIAKYDEQEAKKDLFVQHRLSLSEPLKARYVQLRMHRREGARQQQLAEIAIWGSSPEAGVTYLDASSRPAARSTARTVQSGIVNLDWQESSKVAAGARGWKVYKSLAPFESTQDAGVELVKSVKADESSALVYPLEPGQTYYFGVAAVYPEGENPAVHATPVTMPLPLACDTFGDMVAINHYWGGASNTVSHGPNQDAYEVVALDLLEQSGIRHIRWWAVNEAVYQRYYAKGIGVFTHPHANNIPEATKLGVHAFAGPANEPDLKTTPIATYVENLKKAYAKMQSVSPRAVMGAPSSGLEDTSIEWLDRFYQQGGGGHFDVLDLHTYTKIAGGHKVPEGYPRGAPEALYDDMSKVQAVLSKHGDADIPLISTEFGYSEAVADNPSGPITPQIKADYLVRGLVIHHALGFKRVFLYSFWDDGTDINFSEHNFGLIDYHLQKKPAYHAVQTLIDQLGDCELVGPVSGMVEPSFGYVYRSAQDETVVNVIWDGSGDRRGVFHTSAATVTTVDIFGKQAEILPDKEGRFGVFYGSSPVYLKASKDIKYISSERAKRVAAADAGLEVSVEHTQLIAGADAADCPLEVTIDNPGGDATIDFIVTSEQGERLAETSYPAAAGKSTAFVAVPVDAAAPMLSKYVLRVVERHPDGLGSTMTSHPFYVRRLNADVQKPVTVQKALPGLEQPVVVLVNDKLEVMIDAHRGGRVLEVIDRASRTNQIHIDYDILPGITNVPFAFGIWDTFNGVLKNDPMKLVEAESGRLKLVASVDDLEIAQLWSLENHTLELSIEVLNRSSAPRTLAYKSHPEYTVGGVGESQVDVFYYPTASGVEKLPFWSGLGEKEVTGLSDSWWAVVDMQSNLVLKQRIIGDGWATPRLWFGQGHYNVELLTSSDLTIRGGESWTGKLRWTVSPIDSKKVEEFVDSLE